jgi:ribosome-associated protein
VTDKPASATDTRAGASQATTSDEVPATPAVTRGDTAPGARRPGLPVREGPARPRGRLSVVRTPGGAGSAGASTLSPDPHPPLAVDQEALDLAHRIVDLCADRKASDIVLLDVRALTTVTDYFVICSGASERQLGAITDGIAEALREAGVRTIGREGGASAHWALLDYGSVIVHVMAPPERDYYALEKLWADAPLLIRLL